MNPITQLDPNLRIHDPFASIISHVLATEGGYVHDPDDPGGETKYGISKRAYPEVDIAGLTRQQAIFLYHRDYWLTTKSDILPPGIAALVFDAAVNHGPAIAIRMLQRSIGTKADGRIGPKTIAAVHQRKAARTIAEYSARRAVYYHDIIRRRPTSRKYLLGWMRRNASIQSLAHELTEPEEDQAA